MLEIRAITYRAQEISKNAEEAREEIISDDCWAEGSNMSLELVLVRKESRITNL